MIRGGGRTRKATDAKEENEDEECSEGTDIGAEDERVLTPAISSGPSATIQYLHADRAPEPPDPHLDDGQYEDLRRQHFQSADQKDPYHEQPAEYAIPADFTSSLGEVQQHGPPGHIFGGEAFGADSYTNMQDIRHHGELFSPSEQQVMGQWGMSATPDLYPMHYSGEPSQTPVIHPPDGDNIFGHYSYPNAQKQQQYRHSGHGYPATSHAHFPGHFEDDLARFQRFNNCSFVSGSTQKALPASIMQHHSYDLPSHIRA
jgi:hypothetical protein